MKKILLVGETWFKHTIHVKGFDKFTESSYGEGSSWIIEALEEGNFHVDHVANHLVDEKFPKDMDEIQDYDLIILSDIGSNTLLLAETTFNQSQININKCDLIRDYVLEGGSFLMIGGYMSFSGIDGTSRYEETSISEILAVSCLGRDDRVEKPEGIKPEIKADHEIFENIPQDWPHFLGYNKTMAREDSQVLATINGDPFIAIADFGQGRSAAFTSDCAPHWGPKEFTDWEYYNQFWINLANYLVK